MVGILNIDVSDTRMKYYKEWVVKTQGKDINEYIGELINDKMESLKKQEGKCKERSILLTKGRYKGSCIWQSQSNSYKVYLRTTHNSVTYGFFSNLHSAERELKRLFKNNEQELMSIAKEKQQYYQEQHRLTTSPRLTDNTINIIKIVHGKKGLVLFFAEPFNNTFCMYKGKPKTQQKSIWFAKSWFKHYPKKQVLQECVRMDDPLQILQYREDLKERLREYKKQLKQEEKKCEEG